MAIETAPTGWVDRSDHEDGDLDYHFRIERGNRRATILRAEWMGATAWKLNVTTDAAKGLGGMVQNTVGEFESLSDAVVRGEEWLASDATVWNI